MSNIKTVIDEKEKAIYTDEPVICSSCDERIWRNVFIFESGRKYCNKCMRAKYMYDIKEVKDDQENYQQVLDANEIIPESKWNSNSTFEGITLLYWLGDDILTDELEEVIFDPLKNSLAGFYSLAGLLTDEVIEKAKNDPENYKLFVRNHEFNKDYKISFVNRAFWESHQRR